MIVAVYQKALRIGSNAAGTISRDSRLLDEDRFDLAALR
jgi:hypothetical protein